MKPRIALLIACLFFAAAPGFAIEEDIDLDTEGLWDVGGEDIDRELDRDLDDIGLSESAAVHGTALGGGDMTRGAATGDVPAEIEDDAASDDEEYSDRDLDQEGGLDRDRTRLDGQSEEGLGSYNGSAED